MFFYRILCILSVIFYAAACGGGGGSGDDTESLLPNTVMEVSILPVHPLMRGLSEERIPNGSIFQCQAKVLFSDGTSVIVDSDVLWETSNSNASITASGVLTTLESGEVTLYASIDNVFTEKKLIISEATLTAIQVTPESSSVAKGQQQQFMAQGVYSDKTSADISSMVSWSSSDVAIATVSTTGLTTAKTPGTATITASVDGISSTANLIVTEATLIEIQVTPESSSVAKGQEQRFLAQGMYSDKTSADISSIVSWSSNDVAIATVSTTGLTTAKTPGTATITASVDGISSTANLVVTEATLIDIQVTPESSSVAKGQEQRFLAQGVYSDKTSADISSIVSWSSSDVPIATVSTTGLAIAKSTGTTTITASYDGIVANVSLAVHEPGQVVAWGATMAGDNSAVQAQLTNVKAIYSTGIGATQPTGAFAVLKQDGSVITWGDPSGGGDSSAVQTELTNINNITPSGFAFAALKHDGSVITWGSVLHGGDSSLVQDQLHNVQSITANNGSFAALKNDGTVVTWGNQSYGGYSDHIKGQLVNVKAVYHSNNGAAALKEDGTVVTWGFADGSGVQHLLNDVQAIFSNYYAFAALKSDGTVVTWGDSRMGGNSSSVQSKLVDVKTIYNTHRSFAALKNDGNVVTWGASYAGGDSSAVQSRLVDIRSLSATASAFAALGNDGTVVTWGQMSSGGDSEKVQLELYDIQTITGAGDAFAALRLDGKVVTWGDVNRGGNSAPVQSELYNVQAIFPNGKLAVKHLSIGTAFAALRLDGSLITWGSPQQGGDSSKVQDRLINVVSVTGTIDAFAAIVDTSK
ncbi:Ig-like domain-containing protein [Aeromonas sobria]|nr:Ig-like domain-containing protein [Aeromonas sobria]